MAKVGEKFFNMAFYPWFALGHLTSFLHLSNKLAERGHKISFFLPTKTRFRFESLNTHPDLITFIPIVVPHVDGLPLGTETTSDIPFTLHTLLMNAMDLTEPVIETHLRALKPHFVFFDFTHWMPALARKLGLESVHYCTISPATVGYLISPERKLHERNLTATDLMEPPPNFPPSSIKLRAHEARELVSATVKEYGCRGITFMERQVVSFRECDAICFKTCREMEGDYCTYIETQFNNRVILSGPVMLEPAASLILEPQFAKILDAVKAGSLIFSAFGSECILKKDQLQELVLGLELTGLPFLAALKPPLGSETIETALPEGFQERTKGRGIVYGGWVQQQLILKHPSVGCFLTHCGSGSLTEAMTSHCQLVLLPNAGDQIINARLMSGDLRVGVEIEKGDEDGLFTRDGVCKAVKAVMDFDSEVGKEVRRNHERWREFLLSEGLENSYIDGLVRNLRSLLFE